MSARLPKKSVRKHTSSITEEAVDSMSEAALGIDFTACETVEEAPSFRADAEELSCAANDDAGATIDS